MSVHNHRYSLSIHLCLHKRLTNVRIPAFNRDDQTFASIESYLKPLFNNHWPERLLITSVLTFFSSDRSILCSVVTSYTTVTGFHIDHSVPTLFLIHFNEIPEAHWFTAVTGWLEIGASICPRDRLFEKRLAGTVDKPKFKILSYIL